MTYRVRPKVRTAAGALVVAPLLIWGCPAESRVHEVGPCHRPALHAVHAEHLAATMADINKSHRKAHRLPVRQMRDRELDGLAHCAGEIADYAAKLPDSVDAGALSAEDLAIFKRLAAELRASAEALQAAARNRDQGEARAAFAKLTSTCNSCHAAFRSPPGLSI